MSFQLYFRGWSCSSLGVQHKTNYQISVISKVQFVLGLFNNIEFYKSKIGNGKSYHNLFKNMKYVKTTFEGHVKNVMKINICRREGKWNWI